MQNTYKSLPELFERCAKNSTAAVYYSDGSRETRHTMGELYALSLKVGHYLSRQSLPRGSYIALMSYNRPEWLAIYMGIINAGYCALTIDPHLSAIEVRNLIADSKARIFFIERALFASVRTVELQDMVAKFVVLDASLNYIAKADPFSWIENNPANGFQPVPGSPDDGATLIYTSGTTGRPKGVVLKHKNLLSQISLTHPLGISKKSRVLMVLPLNHAYSLSTCFLAPMGAGASIFILNSLMRTDLLKCMQDHRITSLILVPAILTQFHKGLVEKLRTAPNYAQFLFHWLKSSRYLSHDGSRLLFLKRRLFAKVHEIFGGQIRTIVSGAAGLDEDIARTFNTLGLPIYEGYGLTETSPVVAFNYPGQNKPGTVGRPLSGVSIKICSAGENGVGEIAVKGGPVFDGYKNDQPGENSSFDSEGHFLTGDLGKIDKKGFLTICGRSKDVIVLPSGKNVFPSEIEDFYLQSECFKEIAILGIPREIGKKAEEIYAVIVPNIAFFKTNNISDTEGFIKSTILEMSDKLPGWCRINRYAIRYEPLPRTPTNKVKKFLLRDDIIKRMSETEKPDIEVSAEALLQSPLGKLLSAAIARVKGGKVDITLSSHLFLDLGFDSLSVSELFVTLETALGARIPKETAFQMRTVQDALTLLGEFCIQQRIQPATLTFSEASTSSSKTSWAEVLETNVPPEVSQETRLRLEGRKKAGGLLRRVFTTLSAWIGKILFRYEVTGLDRLPDGAPVILAADHFNYIDALFVLWALPRRFRDKLFCIGKREHLQHLHRVFFGWLAGMIPIDRSGNFIPALQAGKTVLKEGQALLIFPEGTRSQDACINEFKSGVGILGETSGMPVIPIHLEGTYGINRPENKLPRFCKVKIHFGEPVMPGDVNVPEGVERHEAITAEIKRRIIELGAKTRIERRRSSQEDQSKRGNT